MFKLFNKPKKLEKKGYLLVIAFDNKEKVTINYIFNKEKRSFDKKKIFNISAISHCFLSLSSLISLILW